jgi:hypothetical protein
VKETGHRRSLILSFHLHEAFRIVKSTETVSKLAVGKTWVMVVVVEVVIE